MHTITSEQNPKFKIWKSLLTSKGRKNENLFLLSGEKIIFEILKNKSWEKEALLFKSSHLNSSHHNFFSLFQHFKSEIMFYELQKNLFDELDVVGTQFPLLVLKSKPIPKITLPMEPEGLEIVCPVGDPQNLGAIIRTALGFRVQKIILLKNSADPYHPKVLKSSSGSSLDVSFYKLDSHLKDVTSDFLLSNDYGLDFPGNNMLQFYWPKNCRLWLGEEGPGLKLFPKEKNLSIPINPQLESLNVAVACGIAMYSYSYAHFFKSSNT